MSDQQVDEIEMQDRLRALIEAMTGAELESIDEFGAVFYVYGPGRLIFWTAGFVEGERIRRDQWDDEVSPAGAWVGVGGHHFHPGLEAFDEHGELIFVCQEPEETRGVLLEAIWPLVHGLVDGLDEAARGCGCNYVGCP